jgi:hypothetical protein
MQPQYPRASRVKTTHFSVYNAWLHGEVDATTTLIVPGNMSEVSNLIGSAMQMVKAVKTPA